MSRAGGGRSWWASCATSLRCLSLPVGLGRERGWLSSAEKSGVGVGGGVGGGGGGGLGEGGGGWGVVGGVGCAMGGESRV